MYYPTSVINCHERSIDRSIGALNSRRAKPQIWPDELIAAALAAA